LADGWRRCSKSVHAYARDWQTLGVISVRVPPNIKAALTTAAEAERRSLVSMLEVMALEYCRAHRHKPPPVASAGNRKIGRR
jgi:hypothetical protein